MFLHPSVMYACTLPGPKNNPNYVNIFTRMISNFKYKCPPQVPPTAGMMTVLINLVYVRGIMGSELKSMAINLKRTKGQLVRTQE